MTIQANSLRNCHNFVVVAVFRISLWPAVIKCETTTSCSFWGFPQNLPPSPARQSSLVANGQIAKCITSWIFISTFLKRKLAIFFPRKCFRFICIHTHLMIKSKKHMTEEMLNSSFIIITHKHSLRILFSSTLRKKVHLNFVGATKKIVFFLTRSHQANTTCNMAAGCYMNVC